MLNYLVDKTPMTHLIPANNYCNWKADKQNILMLQSFVPQTMQLLKLARKKMG
jgi:hypothetical protein